MHALALVALLGLPAGCRQPIVYVEGPEAAGLAARIHGYLVLKQGRDSTPNDPRLLVLSLPQGDSRVIRKYPDATLGGWIENVSGPARSGRLAFVQEVRFQSKEYSVRTIGLDGSGEREEFWHAGGGFETGFALSPSGTRIAFVGKLTDLQMPGALLSTGPLTIWDVEKRAMIVTGVTAANARLDWLPDSRRLAYVEMVAKTALSREIEASLAGDPKFLSGVETWSVLPVVYVLDVASGQKRYVHLGWHPVVAQDGGSVLVRWGGCAIVNGVLAIAWLRYFDEARRSLSR